MTGPCSRCGTDPGFDWAMCPGCGFRPGGAPATQPGMAPATQPGHGSDRWDPTIIEGTAAGAGARPRARFGDGGDFYQPVNGPSVAGGPLRFRPEEDAGRTILDRGFDRAGGNGEGDDRTIIDRGGMGFDDDADGDATVIVRGGRKGVSGPLVYLVQRNGIRAGRIHLLADETSIGRGADQDIVLADDTVSKRHAKIRMEEGRRMFWDLASANHSFIANPDGSRARILEPRELQDGDTIFLGEARLTYLEVDRGLED